MSVYMLFVPREGYEVGYRYQAASHLERHAVALASQGRTGFYCGIPQPKALIGDGSTIEIGAELQVMVRRQWRTAQLRSVFRNYRDQTMLSVMVGPENHVIDAGNARLVRQYDV